MGGEEWNMSTVDAKPITAAEFLQMPDMGRCELIRGKIVTMNPPGWRHGRIGSRIDFLVNIYLEDHDIGRTAILDTGVVTEREPDTVRGADVMYHSYQRLPKEKEPDDYPELPPEIIWEVRSPGDREKKVLKKIAEYLNAGVLVVCVVDPQRRCFTTYYPDQPEHRIGAGEVWTAPDILPGFEMPVERVLGKGQE
jgi:Uma2 family endonuclease